MVESQHNMRGFHRRENPIRKRDLEGGMGGRSTIKGGREGLQEEEKRGSRKQKKQDVRVKRMV